MSASPHKVSQIERERDRKGEEELPSSTARFSPRDCGATPTFDSNRVSFSRFRPFPFSQRPCHISRTPVRYPQGGSNNTTQREIPQFLFVTHARASSLQTDRTHSNGPGRRTHRHQRTFWVDTNAQPPRSIWTHPLDDPEYQRSSTSSFAPPPGPPPSHNSYSNNEKSSFASQGGGGGGSSYPTGGGPNSAFPASGGGSGGYTSQQPQTTTSGGKKGIFGKIKDKLNAPPKQQQYYGGGGGGQPMYGGQQGGYYPQQGGGYGRPMMGGGGGMMGGGGRGGGMNPVSTNFFSCEIRSSRAKTTIGGRAR